ncbi:MAG TPA: ABC transporter ATP-binding protein [Bacteroidetes bacterium]|nr:ABC transporter ATP-binding protein [Bacteroidota bacterium]HRR08124.1 ABC transporter ATP-binding protein [Rhodothermales bacterium]
MRELFQLNHYFRKYAYLFWPGIFFCFASAIFSVMVPMIVRYGVDAIPRMVAQYQMVQGTAVAPLLFRQSVYGLLEFGGLVLLVSLLSGICLFIMRQTIIVMSRHVEYDLRNDLYHHLQTLSAGWYTRTPTGDVMSRLTSDIEQVRQYVGPAIMYAARSIVVVIVAVVVMFMISPTLTWYSMIPMPLLAIAIYYISRLSFSRSQAIQEQYAVLTSRSQEVFSGIRVIKAYAREAFESDEFDRESDEYRKRNMGLARVEAAFRPAFVILIGMSVVIVIWVGGDLYMQGQISIGNIAEYIIYVTLMTWPVASMGYIIMLIQRAKASWLRLNKIFHTKPEVADNEQTKPTITHIDGHFEFREVTFRYAPDGPDVLKCVNFQIEAGKTLAIVGRTGSGKTTIAELMLRLYDTQSGEILVDGQNIRTIPLQTLRGAAGYVSQDVFLFSDTIANNIAFGRMDAPDDEVSRAAAEADLLENVQGFSEGFETFVGERGITLSGGQKQRTSIARALVRNPKLLILDDALSAVDTATEAKILEALRKHYGKRTVVIISHRISAVQDADLILVIDNGEVVESGTHEALLDHKGLYKDLYTKQLLEEEIAALT